MHNSLCFYKPGLPSFTLSFGNVTANIRIGKHPYSCVHCDLIEGTQALTNIYVHELNLDGIPN